MDPYIGEIRPVAFGFAPRGWALCQGQIMSVQQNAALFSLLGTTYGGNGTTTFALPNLQGMIAVGNGTGSGLSPCTLGEQGGSSSVPLTAQALAAHGHTLPMSPVTGAGTDNAGPTTVLGGNAVPRKGGISYYVTPQVQATTVATMAAATGSAGGNQAHNNMAPYLAVEYIIALQGIFPARP